MNAPTFGQSVDFTATINPAAPGGGTPTGSVSFSVDGVAQPAVSLIGGKATLSLLNLSTGNHTLGVSYTGDTNFNGGSSAPFTQTILQSGSALTLSVPGSSAFGQSIALTASVTAQAPGSGTPTGTVTFMVDGVVQANVNLNGAGQASFVTSTLTAGNHSITAIYNGDNNFAASTGAASQFIGPTTPTVTLSSDSVVADEGQQINFNVVVAAPGVPAAPAGTVTLVIDGNPLVTLNLDASGRAAFSTRGLNAGSHSVQALYSGGTNFVPANSVTQTQTVSAVTPVIVPEAISVAAGKRFTITVEYLNAQGQIASGFNGSVTLSSRPGGLSGPVTVTAVNGVAVFSGLSLGRAGTYTLHATSPGQLQATSAVLVTAGRLKVRGRALQEVGVPFTLSVSAVDVRGALDSRFSGRISIAILRGPRGARLRGNVTVRMVHGKATLKGLKVNVAGTYFLRVSAGPALSALFKISVLGAGRRLS